jgi:UDP:flavonoid glycosyltransferase YjiC (YdhE family)
LKESSCENVKKGEISLTNFNGVRVYFSPCGIGLGHVGRALLVADTLVEKGAEVLFSTYLEGIDFVKKRGYPVVSSPPLNLASDSTGRIDLKTLARKQGFPALPRFMKQVTSEMDYMKAFKPDIVFSDTRLSSVIAGKLLGLPVALMLNQFSPMIPRSEDYTTLYQIFDGGILTLLSRGWGASDVILIPDFPEPYTLSIDSLRIPQPYKQLVRMVGYLLPTRSKNANSIKKIRKEARAMERDKLIYAAISGPLQEREPLIKLLTPIFEKFPIGYKVIMSTGNPEKGSKPLDKGNLTLIPWVKDRYEYLQSCDLVVCKGGHNTILQSICYGKPSIIIPTPNHTEQYANARRAKELGFGTAIHQSDLSLGRLVKISNFLLDSEKIKKQLEEINVKGYTKGVENSINAISKLLA